MSKGDKNAESPATTSLAYDVMSPLWRKVQTVLDGTEALRSAGRLYLPQHEGESNNAYTERLSRCTLFNQTKITLTSWVGRPFGEPIAFTDVPKPVEDLLSNVDLVGNDVHVFSRDWFSDGVAKAYSHVLIDFPRTEPNADGTPRTLADDDKQGVRPYWVHINPEQLIFANAEMVDGREVLREVRILELVVERVGFAEQQVQQIRQIITNPDTTQGCIVQLYRPTGKEKNGEPEWAKYEPSYTISLKEIPLVTFYSHRDAFMLGVPPLADLADLNIAHWQSTSDQRNILTVTRFPILALKGSLEEGKELVVGPNQWLWSPDGTFYYVEHSGKAIEAGRQDLTDLEAQMAEYGAQFLKKQPSGQTATARLLDTAEATSPLQDMVTRFSFALSQALDITAKWLKLEDGGDAALSATTASTETDQAVLGALDKTRERREISRKVYLERLVEWKVLPEDFNAEEDQAQLEQEQMDLFEMPPVVNNNLTGPDPDDDENKESEEEDD